MALSCLSSNDAVLRHMVRFLDTFEDFMRFLHIFSENDPATYAHLVQVLRTEIPYFLWEVQVRYLQSSLQPYKNQLRTILFFNPAIRLERWAPNENFWQAAMDAIPEAEWGYPIGYVEHHFYDLLVSAVVAGAASPLINPYGNPLARFAHLMKKYPNLNTEQWEEFRKFLEPHPLYRIFLSQKGVLKKPENERCQYAQTLIKVWKHYYSAHSIYKFLQNNPLALSKESIAEIAGETFRWCVQIAQIHDSPAVRASHFRHLAIFANISQIPHPERKLHTLLRLFPEATKAIYALAAQIQEQNIDITVLQAAFPLQVAHLFPTSPQ